MRSLMVCTAVATVGWPGIVAAESVQADLVRRVELIRMDSAAARESEAKLERLSKAAPEQGMTPVPPDFRVHDLRKRWVEFQMARNLAEKSATEGAMPAQADTTQGSPIMRGIVPAAPAIAIPLWMRGGISFGAVPAPYQPACAPLPYRATGFLKPDTETRRASHYQMMSAIACEYGIPIGLFDAMIIRESRYRPDAVSPKSAFGLTQLMPGTAATLGVNRYSVEENLRGGAKYLRQQLDTFGHYHLALAAYNAGPGRVEGGVVPRIAETQAYVDDVLSNWARLSGVSRQVTILPQRGSIARVRVSPRPGRVANVSLF